LRDDAGIAPQEDSIVIIFLLIVHSLVGVALLGALTHQSVSTLRGGSVRGGSFVNRYSAVNQRTFTTAVVLLYVVGLLLGATIYPSYRLEVRIPFEEMSLGWAVGLFEMKEHFAGIGLGLLPLYASLWREDLNPTDHRNRVAITLVLAGIVWWAFIIGHVLNNIRGLS
jgi:hypothetical protein